MSVFIHLEGALEPVEARGDFDITIGKLEIATQRGLSFMVLQSEKDHAQLAVQIAKIISVRQGSEYIAASDDN